MTGGDPITGDPLGMPEMRFFSSHAPTKFVAVLSQVDVRSVPHTPRTTVHALRARGMRLGTTTAVIWCANRRPLREYYL